MRRDSLKYPETDAHWDIPGGRIDAHEELGDALAREVAEEVGMELVGTPRLLAAQDIMVPSNDLHVVRLTYSGNAIGSPHLSDEHSEYAWMKTVDILATDVDPYVRKVLEEQV